MKIWTIALTVAVIATMAGLTPAAAAPAAPSVLRCGWLDKPSPGNAWLHDRDGEWVVGIQGGHQATGELPRFAASRWVRTGSGSAGYGCVCLRVLADSDSREIALVLSGRALALSVCRSDAAIKGMEPENPLK